MSFKNIFCAILSLTLVSGGLTGCGEKTEKSESTESEETLPELDEKTLPELDEKKVAADEARGIKFSKDKRTLKWYNSTLPDKEYTIPNGVTIIAPDAFFPCKNLTTITIPNSVTSIGERAFNVCENLTTITIPNSVTSIGELAFNGCKTKVVIAQDNPNFSTDAAGALIDKKNKTLLYLPSDFSGEYIIPDDITSIGKNVFCFCENLTTITIPNSVTSIGRGAFSGCENLTTITIPNSVTSIGERAFSGCAIKSVTIPDNVTYIGDSAFCGIQNIKVSPNNKNFFVDASGALIDRKNKRLLYLTPTFSGNYDIPEGIKSIGDSAFFKCNISSVTIPDGVTSINYFAFYGCKNLTTITIPNSVTSIGHYAFDRCKKLRKITIPNSVTSIGKDAFRDAPCEASVKLQFPNYN